MFSFSATTKIAEMSKAHVAFTPWLHFFLVIHRVELWDHFTLKTHPCPGWGHASFAKMPGTKQKNPSLNAQKPCHKLDTVLNPCNLSCGEGWQWPADPWLHCPAHLLNQWASGSLRNPISNTWINKGGESLRKGTLHQTLPSADMCTCTELHLQIYTSHHAHTHTQ